MKKLYKTSFSVLTLAALSIMFFTDASTGPGANFGAGYTGAPFDNGGAYCSNCHGGGNFTPSVAISLLDANNLPVANYVAGASYTVHIVVSTSTGIDPNTRYGFQVMSVRNSNNANTGTWGPIPIDYHSVVINGRTYVEHSDRLISGTINIPWTAASPGVGSVKFYAAGNVVDFDMGTSGDNPTTNSLLVAQNTLPLRWLYFRGKEDKGAILLEWATTDDISGGEYILERSSDGRTFQELSRVNANVSSALTHTYSFTDSKPSRDNFYRISLQDISGGKNTFQVIHVSGRVSSHSIAYVTQKDIVVLLADQDEGTATIELTGLDGRSYISKELALTSGANNVRLERPAAQGIYFIRIKKAGEVLFSEKVLVQ